MLFFSSLGLIKSKSFSPAYITIKEGLYENIIFSFSFIIISVVIPEIPELQILNCSKYKSKFVHMAMVELPVNKITGFELWSSGFVTLLQQLNTKVIRSDSIREFFI